MKERTVKCTFLLIAIQLCVLPLPVLSDDMADLQKALHDHGLQRLLIWNNGKFGDPVYNLQEEEAYRQLEYPAGSGDTFIYHGGLWIGAVLNGDSIVSVCADNNGTQEFSPLDFAVGEDDQSVGWLEGGTALFDTNDQENAIDGLRYTGIGRMNVDDDDDGRVDEDPSGDMSHDFLDNDHDGYVDGNDSDFDGDAVVGSLDDDGDGVSDEDDYATASQELISAYVDTCGHCVLYPDDDGFTPLNIRVIQHTRQWSAYPFDDFIGITYIITNIGTDVLRGVYCGFYLDFDVGKYLCRNPDDYTFYLDDIQTAVGSDWDGDGGALLARFIAVRALGIEDEAVFVTYKNNNHLQHGELNNNADKYARLSSSMRDPDSQDEGDWVFLLTMGPVENLGPGEFIRASYALISGFEENDIREHAIKAKEMYESDMLGPSIPPSPEFEVHSIDHGARIVWDNSAERNLDRYLHRMDFQGYHIWRCIDGDPWTLIGMYDLPDTIDFNAGWPPPQCPEEGFEYEFEDRGLLNGIEVTYAVTAFDNGDNGDGIHMPAWDERHGGIGVFESSKGSAVKQSVVTGSACSPQGVIDQIYVVPNPYCGSSKLLVDPWARADQSGVSRHMEFRNLPEICRIEIYTLAGDRVHTLYHDSDYSIHLWDLRNKDGREVAGGVYLYRVVADGNERIGKFIIIR